MVNSVITKIQGGLGNQMFQYAFGKKIANMTNRSLILDLSRLDDRTDIKGHTIRELDLNIFDLKLSTTTNVNGWEKGKSFKFIIEPRYIDYFKHRNFFTELPYNLDNLRDKDKFSPIYLDGHWQKSEFAIFGKKYFQFKDLSQSDLHTKIKTSETPTCCINVRRGDYLTNYKDFFHQLTPENYFNLAIELMENIHDGDVKFYVFSDDIEWCQNNIKSRADMIFVPHSEAGPKYSKYFQMMTCCDHFIIPNSTFGYWAAILGNCPDKIVISPRQWFTNTLINDYSLKPESWITI